MNLYELRSIYKPGFLKPMIGVLDELEYQFSYIHEAFEIVRNAIERNMYANLGEWKKDLADSNNPRLHIYLAINNVAYAHLQTGRYHSYFGEIAEFGAGKGLVDLYVFTAKELVVMGQWTKKEYKEYMDNLKEAIATVG